MESLKKGSQNFIDQQSSMSFVIKALYFPKAESKVHQKFQKLMNYEYLLFTPIN
jgi:hypothetical protein